MSQFSYFLHLCKRLQSNHSDVVIILDGQKGSGKSTLAIEMVREYLDLFSFVCPHCQAEFYKSLYKIGGDPENPSMFVPDELKGKNVYIKCPQMYDLNLKTGKRELVSGCGKTFKYSERKKIKWAADKFIAYDNKDAMRKMLSMPRESPLIFDEAFNFMAAADHMRGESKELKKLFTVVRPRRLFMFLIVPEMRWIDSKYRDVMSHFWIRCLERGYAVIFERDNGIAPDKYHIKSLEKNMTGIKMFTPMDKVKKNLKKHVCYFDGFRFGELNEKVYDEYELVRNARNLQRQVEEMEFTNKDMAKLAAYNLLFHWERIHQAVMRSRNNKITYQILRDEIFLDPLKRKPIASDTTIRNWINGIESYVESQGKTADGFESEDVS